ncbi:probable multidrug resistance-associated protein lethal(2)03659 isoform X1 [Rhopalosiphum maidis]|uniref:probable multidrug resistance-associated protein lethal(2)03659 isoform X1 n=2 Tax=Rhopalosiphum maidis TaxID=43146 RepID=UPI000F0017A4|nr:probable multidrug resistance-associated protein lethal(2)03659 isoform X1 [Rhopalosiphum maidis]XP_026820569.1 probable multidrug resistance-associated protein lethal(2)03659 isoform X1 [Rhopalosiphum maidis]
MYRLITDADKKVKRPQHPRNSANIFEIISYSWMLNLFKTGRKRDLEENDLYITLNDHNSSLLGNELEKKWKLELASAFKLKRNPSLTRALIRMSATEYMFYGFLLSVDKIILKMSQPLFIGGILAYFNPVETDKADLGYAYMCAFGLVFSMFTSMVLQNVTLVEILHCGMKMRIACCSVIFRKSLRLNNTAIGKTTVGQVINLLSNDVNRFDRAATFLHYLWIGPLQSIVVTYFLWQEIGVSSLLCIVIMILIIPFQGWLGKKLSKTRLKTANKTDERIRLMNEIISGIKVIKMYTWEKCFSKLVIYIRKKEIEHVKVSAYIRDTLTSLAIIQTRFQLFISILSYVLLGNYITVQKIFVITTYYSILMPTMTFFFCQGLGQISELQVSIKRIQDFLLLGEKDDYYLPIASISDKPVVNSHNELIIYPNKNNTDKKYNIELLNTFCVEFSKATAKWMNNQTSNAIENISLAIKPGSLVAIVGAVGAGKSSIIQAILRELPLSEGVINVRGVISYASQEPWIFAGSVQQNIVFNSPMNKDRYKQVIKICKLKSDFEQFPYGDKTIVGERGATLSGGQRVRINLARTLYKQADIYLLDDPLSAVDPNVGSHLFEVCIKGFLKEKTCILVTHQMQCLTDVDQIVVMENAKILAKGTYEELCASNIDLTNYIQASELPDDKYIISDESILNTEQKSTFKRRASVASIISESGENNHSEDQVEPSGIIESRSSGNISYTVYLSYFLASGKKCKILFFIFICIITQVLTSAGDFWITYWVNLEEHVFQNKNNESTITFHDSLSDVFWWMTISRQTCIYVFGCITFLLIIIITIRLITFVSISMSASINLHNNMFNTLIRATTYFFNTNLSGSILNRFSKDIGTIDEMLPVSLLDCIHNALNLLGVLIVVGIINIYLMIPAIILAAIFYKITVFYLSLSRSVKRLEASTRSPVFTHLNATIQGLTTIRAFEAETILSKEFDNHQDLHSSAWYLFITSSRAFAFWLDLICFIYTSIVTFSFLVISNTTFGGNVGLAISQTCGLAGLVQFGMRQTAELENHMTSVERVLEYTNAPQECSTVSTTENLTTLKWPSNGRILFKNFHLRYGPTLSYAINNLNVDIEPMQKVGIVGRTGAGKSSLILALFRLAFNEGKIIIDGIEIDELELDDLRSKISIIPQEPVLFSGTMRSNLDPFNEYSDHILLNALEEVELKDVVENLPDGLYSKMSEGGSNFSVGQRQLICLARAIIQSNKILVLDEATANVDPHTDALIQKTIRNKFRTCTVLTIAHRLNTVIDSDKVLVMDKGTMVEFDHPYNLLQNKEGVFYKLVEQTGPDTVDLLHRLATESYHTTYSVMESTS